MTLENFDLAKPYATVELVGLGHRWDLHSWADFVALSFTPGAAELSLEWQVPASEPNPWGSSGNRAKGCRLRFRGVSHFVVTQRDSSFPPAEASTIEAIGKVVPGEADYPFKNTWQSSEPFYLRFEFRDTRTIEVGAETAVLEAVE